MTILTSPSLLRASGPRDCPPRFSTPRTDRRTLGPKVGEVARMLGTPLMPWQQHVVDVALELEDDGTPAYREVVLLVPRQSGKTTLDLSVSTHRAMWHESVSVYAAQTRNDAREKWEDEFVKRLDRSPIGKARPKPYRVRKQNGREAVMWRNGSRFGITANTEKSGHGPTVDLAMIDEAFSHSDSRLEQAFKPAMATRLLAQLWVKSTAGKHRLASPYLWGKVEAGRERVVEGRTSGVCYFEWSAPDDADRGDPETWWRCMPALGRTVAVSTIAADFESMDPTEFDRAYLDRWGSLTAESVIPWDRWKARQVLVELDGPYAWGVDVAPDGSSAAICVAGRSGSNAGVDVAEHRPGSGWVPDELARMTRDHGASAVVIDPAGPAMSLIPELEQRGVDVRLVSVRDHAAAAQGFLDAVMNATVDHSGPPELDAAVQGAARRMSGDVWLWARRQATVDITPLVAAALALYGARTAPVPVVSELQIW